MAESTTAAKLAADILVEGEPVARLARSMIHVTLGAVVKPTIILITVCGGTKRERKNGQAKTKGNQAKSDHGVG